MLTLLLLSLGAGPTFTVENKCPPAFSVVNLIPAKVKAAPAVAARTFPAGALHAGHNCQLCGRQQLRIDSYAGNGQHYHRCSYDGALWRH